MANIRDTLLKTRLGLKDVVRALLKMVTKVENYKKGMFLVKKIEDFVKDQHDIIEKIAKENLEGNF